MPSGKYALLARLFLPAEVCEIELSDGTRGLLAGDVTVARSALEGADEG